MDKELKDILYCLMQYTSDGDSTQDAKYLEVIQTDLVMYFKKALPQANVIKSVCNRCEFDKKCNMQDNGRYKEICSYFKQTDC